LSSAAVATWMWKANFKRGAEHAGILRDHVLVPAVAVHLLFVLAYYTNLIPPVPVAVKKIGVYYGVEKSEGKYLGKHLRPFWKVWDRGSQEFLAREGDKVHVLLSVFSPARFEDQVFLRWWHEGTDGKWRLEDSIPLSILGGREEGFRGYGVKQFYGLGAWRVTVETNDGREVGRIGLNVVRDASMEEREFKTDAF
jgi:hypothetical protein